jgi:hypothetical protein
VSPVDAPAAPVELAKGFETALRRGHELDSDPAMLSSVRRWTCGTCGRAVLCCDTVVYGSALSNDCVGKD